jgi:hypothetical protein
MYNPNTNAITSLFVETAKAAAPKVGMVVVGAAVRAPSEIEPI